MAIKSPHTLRITEQHPQTVPENIPGFRGVTVRFVQTSMAVAVYQTLAVPRAISIIAGEVRIVDEGRPEAAASSFTLASPTARGRSEAGADGARLQIISACPFRHVVKTPERALNGTADTITFTGLGAIELYAHGGRWIVLSAAGVKVT